MAAQPQPSAGGLSPPPDLPNLPKTEDGLVNWLRTFSLWCRQGFAAKLDAGKALPGVMVQSTDQAVANPPVWMFGVDSGGTATLAPVALGTGKAGDPVPISDPPIYDGPTGDGEGNFGLGVAPPAGQTPADPATSGGDIGGWLFGWGITVNNWANNLYFDGANWRYWHDGAGMNAQLGNGFFVQAFPAGAADDVADAPTTIFNVDVDGNARFAGNVQAGGGIVQVFSPQPGANAHCWFYDWNGASKGILYWENTANQMIWSNQESGSSISLTANGWINLNSFTTINSNLYLQSVGISYPGAAYGSGSYFAFGWSTVISGLTTVSVDNGGAAYALANASDERMKEGVETSTFDCLSTVLELPLRQFRWKEFTDPWKLKEARAAKDAPVVPVGVVAQEIHKIFPHGVIKGDDHDDHLGVVWGLDQNAMISLLVGAVQQLTARVQELEAR